LIFSGGVIWTARRRLKAPGRRSLMSAGLVLLAALFAVAGLGLEFQGHWAQGLRPQSSSYAAMVYLDIILSAQIMLAILIMCFYCIARILVGKLDRIRVASLENTSLLLYYLVGQALLGLLLIHGFPRIMGPLA
ncbi:MAG: cytochrome ubiquinol oxidase subunit I, partial [Hyphomonas sp.]